MWRTIYGADAPARLKATPRAYSRPCDLCGEVQTPIPYRHVHRGHLIGVTLRQPFRRTLHGADAKRLGVPQHTGLKICTGCTLTILRGAAAAR